MRARSNTRLPSRDGSTGFTTDVQDSYANFYCDFIGTYDLYDPYDCYYVAPYVHMTCALRAMHALFYVFYVFPSRFPNDSAGLALYDPAVPLLICAGATSDTQSVAMRTYMG